jgi:glucose/arabinose dehydrogenase
LDSPNGVAFRNGALYVAENSRILRYNGIELVMPDGALLVSDDKAGLIYRISYK